jgi:sugar/nucleoside kinase (ribokinase family)
VGVVGDDFPNAHLEFLNLRKIDLSGLQQVAGKTFRWSGEYMVDMNTRETRSVELNVFEHFTPTLPAAHNNTPIVLLANIAPSLQSHVLDQMNRPQFIIADTMDLWINIARADLEALLKRVDMLILNDSEARLFTGENNLIKAGHHIRSMGPRYVAIKKGEHGCLVAGPDGLFALPGFPTDQLVDPTGAGDTFAGGVLGMLAECDALDRTSMHRACMVGTAIASITLSDFSLDALRRVNRAQIDARVREYRAMLEGAGSSQFSRFVP